MISPARGGFPTWRYRLFRIRYVERDRSIVGLGIARDRRSGQVTLTLGTWDITWGRP